MDKEEEKKNRVDAMHNWVMWEGFKAASVATAFAVGGHVYANKRLAFYQRQTIPFKTFLFICIPTAVFFTVTGKRFNFEFENMKCC